MHKKPVPHSTSCCRLPYFLHQLSLPTQCADHCELMQDAEAPRRRPRVRCARRPELRRQGLGRSALPGDCAIVRRHGQPLRKHVHFGRPRQQASPKRIASAARDTQYVPMQLFDRLRLTSYIKLSSHVWPSVSQLETRRVGSYSKCAHAC